MRKLHLLIVTTLLFLCSCQSTFPSATEPGSNQADATTPSPTIERGFSGRILFATYGSNGYSIYTLQSGFGYPVPIWSNLGGVLPDNFEIQPSKILLVAIGSPDGNWVVLNNVLVNLKSGKSKTLLDKSLSFIYPSFSPDNRFLALGVGGFTEQAKVVIIDLQDGTQKEIYTGECEHYSIGGWEFGETYTYCGEIDQPTWLDENTLVFSAYQGKMPSCVHCGQTNTLEPNALLIMTPDGEILREIAQSGMVFMKVYTKEDYREKKWLAEEYDLIQALQYSDVASAEDIFLSVSALRKGEIKVEETTYDKGYGRDKIVVSPNGAFQYYPGGYLINTQTMETMYLSYFTNCHGGVQWSPNSDAIVCLSEPKENSFLLMIYSTYQSYPIFGYDMQDLDKIWWNLVVWQPD